ncbi:MAG TPA: NAD(P)H-binding protein [Gaiellaceae bacterium]|nr:NAD(P)H-binding protein [Gaiellaceae bacterium]
MNAVTGVFSYTGRAIAEELLSRGEGVRTLSRADKPGDQLRNDVEFAPLRFDAALTASLDGVRTLYNTYWIRFPGGGVDFDAAVSNTITLFEAARRAGVERIVHVSVSNADRADDLPYFRGKHELERWLASSGVRYAIVRPTLVFGAGDILINNLAWIARRTPIFVLPGRCDFRVQPVSLRDTARLCVDAADGSTIDAAGPETLTFRRLVELVREATGSRCAVLPGTRSLGLGAIRVAGLLLRDTVVTRDELEGLSRSLLTTAGSPTGTETFRDWLAGHGSQLGRSYVSERARNFT